MSTERINTFPEAEAYLESLINFEKAPGFDYAESLKLDRVFELLSATGDPHLDLRSIQIAGTKGKGSTAIYLDALLRAHGLNTGLYTSPHLITFLERIRLSGQMVPKEKFTRWLGLMQPDVENRKTTHPEEHYSFFDVLTALALSVFKETNVDYSVLETGMGGRLDATNVVSPDVSVVTSIALEHTQHLGSTLSEIASEKAGIIKRGAKIVLAEQPDEAMSVLMKASQDTGNIPWVIGRDILVTRKSSVLCDIEVDGRRFDEMFLKGWGPHQQDNAACAIAAMCAAGIDPDIDATRDILASVVLPGRVQLVHSNPDVVVDPAHTDQSAGLLFQAIKHRWPHRRWVLVFGCGRDKRADMMASHFAPHCSAVILPDETHSPRAMPNEEVVEIFGAYDTDVVSAPSVSDALGYAEERATGGEIIVATGSFIVVGEAMSKYGADVTI